MKKAMSIFLLVCLLIMTESNECHYSCKQNSCVPQTFYTFCTSCHQPSELLPFNNPANIQQDFRQSNVVTGLCTGFVSPSTQINILGIITIIIFIVVIALTRSNQAIYLFLTIQSFALFSLLEVAYHQPVQYILIALQYLMPFNIISASSKGPDSQYTKFNFYKLQQYFITYDFSSNIIAVGIVTLIVFVSLIIILIARLVKTKKGQRKPVQTQSQNDIKIPEESQKPLKGQEVQQDQSFARDQNLRKVEIAFMTIFLFLIQQTSLTILVGGRLKKPGQNIAFLLGVGIVYLIMVIYAIVRSHFIILPYFENDFSMFTNFCKKLMAPIFIIVPIFHQYLIFIFMIIVLIAEGAFTIKNKQYKNRKRSIFYKIIELLCLFIALIYYILQRVNNQSGVSIMRLVFGITLVLSLALIFVEAGFGIYQAFFQEEIQGNSVKNESDVDQIGEHKSENRKNIFEIFQNRLVNQTQEGLVSINKQEDKQNQLKQNQNFDPFILKIEQADQEQGFDQLTKTNISKAFNSLQRNSKKRYTNPNNQQPQAYLYRSSKDSNGLNEQNRKNLQQSNKRSQKQQSRNNQSNGVTKMQQNGEDLQLDENNAKKKKKPKDFIDRQLRMRYGIK